MMTNKFTQNYTTDQVLQKLNKGQFLSDVEAAYLEMEARKAAEKFIGQNKNKGAAFTAKVLEAAAQMALEQQRDREREVKETKPSRDEPDDSSNAGGPMNTFGSIYGQGK